MLHARTIGKVRWATTGRQNPAQPWLDAEAGVWVAIGCGRIMNAPLKIAELVEHEQRVVAVTAEVSVPRRALLSSTGWALGTIHVENDVVGKRCLQATELAGRRCAHGMSSSMRLIGQA